jgi:hypothetical protein
MHIDPSTPDLENIRGRSKFQSPRNLSRFPGDDPACLPKVLSVGLDTNLTIRILFVMAIRRVIKVDFPRQDQFLPQPNPLDLIV